MLKRTVLLLVALCTLGLFAGCKHEAGESEPSLAGTWYSYEVTHNFVEEDYRAVGDSHVAVYTFNADGTLTSVTDNGVSVPDSAWSVRADDISRSFFRAVTLTDDGRVTSFVFQGDDMVTEENASSFSYQVTDAGISVTVVFHDTPHNFVLQPGENGIYTLTDEISDDEVTWKFKKAE